MEDFRTAFYWLLSVFGILALNPLHSKADLLELFREEYPQAATNLADQYAHVRVISTEQTWDPKGNFLYSYRVEYLRDGNSYCRKKTIIVSGQPTLPVGFVRAEGGNADKYFAISQRMGSDSFAIENFGSINASDFWKRARNQCPPLFATTCGDGIEISDLVKLPNVRLVSAAARSLDGADIVDITVNQSSSGSAVTPDYHLYFTAGSWSFAGWTRPLLSPKWKKGDKFETLELRVSYNPNDPSRLRSIHRWIDSPWLPHVLKSQQIDAIESISFVNVEPAKFTLASFGVEEPAQHTTGSRIIWALAINAALFAIWGTMFLIRTARRRDKKSNKSPIHNNAE